MNQAPKSTILFLENRSITDIWSGVAGLVPPDFNCQLLRFNRAFGSSFPGMIFDFISLPQSSRVPDSRVEFFVQTLCQTDRAVYLHGATERAIRQAVLSVFDILDKIEFDVVIGEVTSVYERAVEFYCRSISIPFLAPMTARIPPDRFFFLDGSSLFPLPIAAEPYEQGLTDDVVETARRNTGKNDLAMVLESKVRLRNSIRTLSGWLHGERLHTPSPLRKMLLMWERVRAKFQLAKIPSVSIEEIDASAIIYCMHVQPESTLDTYSYELWNQANVIEVLAAACKAARRSFFVRPHPRWRHEVTLHLGKVLASGVRVLSTEVGMQDMLRCRPTVVSVSGTVLIEAAAAGAPSVALDRSYLSSFPGVVHVSLADFEKVLAGEIVATPTTPEAQREWFEAVGRFSHQGLISPPEWSSEALSRQNLSDIATGICLAVRWCLQHPRSLAR